MSDGINYLAIDPSTNAGWALRLSDGKIFHGTWKLKKPTEKILNGYLFIRYCKAITKTLADHGVDPSMCRIAYEDQSLNSIGSQQSKHLAEAWSVMLEFWCALKGAKSLHNVSPPSWRKVFIGIATAPKEIVKEDRRAWLKAKTIEICEKRGLRPEDDNAADAIGILFWLINGGDITQEQTRADKKAKTSAKRSQKRLAL